MKTTTPHPQASNAALYREYARLAPWNSKTRAEWLRLAEAAEKHVTRDMQTPATVRVDPFKSGPIPDWANTSAGIRAHGIKDDGDLINPYR